MCRQSLFREGTTRGGRHPIEKEVTMDPNWEVMRMKVCRKCIDSDGKGMGKLGELQ